MRFTTYLKNGQPRLGVLDGEQVIDLAADLRAALAAGTDLIAAGRAAIASTAPGGSSSALTNTGPKPPVASKFLPMVHWPVRFW